ncbi:phospho-N-acetylmuramoyl-pentapeptide-transferase [Clostridium sp. 19966]|uniref:phospho-N-acetylmuramoyl-pentapeptide- transferase n=1 Tax=Clostridium sp. 19966 TaxID=2768166 RepID=UPI0028DDC461|nr:phospho-N-acetylmuramoyl-pentapeptide-transferase [Clostridium sp. 19966]MDT8717538.1 phospho-N-acetylmuramoyl-pentapeptide-transferase [Clostridium sp. 19966]
MNIIVYYILLSFFLSLLIGTLIIPLLRFLKLGQNIREDAPKSHMNKAGTPTFGGIIFITSSIAVMFILGNHNNRESLIAAYSFIAFALVGFVDDSLKTIHKKNEGLTIIQKFLLLLLVSILFTLYIYQNFSMNTYILIPFTSKILNLGIFYVPFIIFFYLSTTNAVNISDGLDGLVASTALLITIFFALVSFGMKHYSLAIFCGCVSGALLSFLQFNSYPAKIIMGDTGALGLGGLLATVAIILRNPLIIAIVGGIYVIEILSDVIQIFFYKLFRKRIFKMAPFHHSLELSGWHESKIVSVFLIATGILCIIGLAAI